MKSTGRKMQRWQTMEKKLNMLNANKLPTCIHGGFVLNNFNMVIQKWKQHFWSNIWKAIVSFILFILFAVILKTAYSHFKPFGRKNINIHYKQGRIVHRSGIGNIWKDDIQKEYITKKYFIIYKYICEMYILANLK